MTAYKKWLAFTNPITQYSLYLSENRFFGKKIKERVKKKWHHRYMRERNRVYSRRGLKKKEQHLFGRIVYSYSDSHGFTSRPKQEGCRPYHLGSVLRARKHNYII